MSRLYLDNSATSFPKAPGVYEAMLDYGTRVGASPGRGHYAESREGAKALRRTREAINTLINGENPDHVVFALNTSDALNLAIKGIVRHRRLTEPNRPIHLITTALDHNSVLRPFSAIAADGEATSGAHGGKGNQVSWTILEGDPLTGRVSASDIAAAITKDTALVAIVHASNVAGTLQPIAEIGAVCRAKNVPFLVDAAQSLGHVPIDVRAMNIDLLAFPGHKGLLGPQGTGGLYIRPGIESILATTREGGTGHLSENDIQPADMPQKYEAGSHNTIGLVGLGVSVRWLLDHGVENIRAHEIELGNILLNAWRDDVNNSGPLAALRLLGPTTMHDRVGVFAFTHDSIPPAEFAAILESSFGILVRSGLTCAPHAHARFGTHPSQGGLGAFRLSFGPFVTKDDVNTAINALRAVCESVPSSAKMSHDSVEATA
jgi:cysteine desulfurase family protein